LSNSTAVVVIPARLESTRLQRKVLADICGWPMLRHVYQRAKEAELSENILVATDSDEVAENVTSWGGNVVMTSPDCTCGTERIASIIDQLDADIVVNVQGDEPLIEPRLIDQLIQATRGSTADMVIPVRKIASLETLMSPNAVKAVLRADGEVMYFSRNAAPFIRDVAQKCWLERYNYWVVLGTASFRAAALREYRDWPESTLEKLEKIEQFRFLEAGKRIASIETDLESIAVDVQEDLELARQLVGKLAGSWSSVSKVGRTD
jgi:3-deoxy-manno-octulosonate cytidylyltransferase (CMP-KDO synthetase)